MFGSKLKKENEVLKQIITDLLIMISIQEVEKMAKDTKKDTKKGGKGGKCGK